MIKTPPRRTNKKPNTRKAKVAPITERLAAIQANLNAPKGQTNTFGGYQYRSCEDILAAVKPLLAGLVLTITDEIVPIGDRFYVKATASISDGSTTVSTSAFAREAASKKGMDDAQVTGSTSSYARKYALNGLLLIDDTKDADSHDNRDEGKAKQPAKAPAYNAATAVKALNACGNLSSLKATFASYWQDAPEAGRPEIKTAYDARKAYIEGASA